MADKYLLEDGSGGYLLEDGSGYYLLDFLEIVNSQNTTVAYESPGTYTVTKTGGANSTWGDAGAFGLTAYAGDFALRLKSLVGAHQIAAGMDSDPTTNDSFASIDFGAIYFGGTWTVYENGTAVAGAFADTGLFWIWRTGTTVGYGRGATLVAAQAAPDRTTTSSATLFFDSAIDEVGDSFEAYLYVPSAAYSLTAPSGSFALSGNAAALKAGHTAVASVGSFAVTVRSASLPKGFHFAAAAGGFALTGNAALVTAARKMVATSGSFTLNGIANSLKVGRLLRGATGSYAVVGLAAQAEEARALSAIAGSFAASGGSASFLLARRMTGASASYSLTGINAALSASGALALAGATASFTLTPSLALLSAGRALQAAPGFYALAVPDAATTIARAFLRNASPSVASIVASAGASAGTFVAIAAPAKTPLSEASAAADGTFAKATAPAVATLH